MNQLTKKIKSLIQKSGPITFSKFIEFALYHEKYGYYSADKRRIGKKGDYYTSPCVHPAFGEIISRVIYKIHKLLKVPNLTIVEMGAGKGYLALDILDSLKRYHPESYNSLNYLIIEHSPYQQEEGKNLLIDHLKRINWISSVSDLKPVSVTGVFISNELVDSLPFHRCKLKDRKFQEIYVGLEDDEFIEIFSKPSSKALEDYFNGYDIEFVDGQEVEVNLNATKWLRDVSTILDKGFVLTIDYGFLAPELFNPTRMKGTFICFYKHTTNEIPYINIGEQDITAHVDFSNLIRVGESVGLNTFKYITQGQFLIDWGILDIIEGYSIIDKSSKTSKQRHILAIKNLFLPELMGDKFKVLIQEKNLGDKLKSFYPESPFKISFERPGDK